MRSKQQNAVWPQGPFEEPRGQYQCENAVLAMNYGHPFHPAHQSQNTPLRISGCCPESPSDCGHTERGNHSLLYGDSSAANFPPPDYRQQLKYTPVNLESPSCQYFSLPSNFGRSVMNPQFDFGPNDACSQDSVPKDGSFLGEADPIEDGAYIPTEAIYFPTTTAQRMPSVIASRSMSVSSVSLRPTAHGVPSTSLEHPTSWWDSGELAHSPMHELTGSLRAQGFQSFPRRANTLVTINGPEIGTLDPYEGSMQRTITPSGSSENVCQSPDWSRHPEAHNFAPGFKGADSNHYNPESQLTFGSPISESNMPINIDYYDQCNGPYVSETNILAQQTEPEHMSRRSNVSTKADDTATLSPTVLTWYLDHQSTPLQPPEPFRCGKLSQQGIRTDSLLVPALPPSPQAQIPSKRPLRPRVERKTPSPRPITTDVAATPDIEYKRFLHRFSSSTLKPYSRERFTPEKKEKAALTRKGGACFLCRVSRKECSPSLDCQNCREKQSKMSTQQLCFRLDLVQCGFFRTRSALWPIPLQEREAFRWTASERESVTLTLQCSNYLNKAAPRIELQARQFYKEETDIVVKKYGLAPHHVLSLPTFAVVDPKQIKKQTEIYLDQYLWYYLSLAKDEENREVSIQREVLMTIELAAKFMKRGQPGSDIIKEALRVWTGSRICGGRWSLVGEETLGVGVINDPTADFHGYVPIPPMMDYQIDTAFIEWMSTIATRLMQRLWTLLEARKDNKKENWWALYLVVFILVNNIEWVYGIQEEYATEHENSEFGQRVRPMSEQMKGHWEWSAKHLLFVFRYSIYRCAWKGSNPFSERHYMEAAKEASMNEEEINYLKHMIDFMKDLGSASEGDSKTQEQRAKSDYQFFWCRRLFDNENY